jgi:2,3-bisphosphoglycerate-dependent phosphoglycerate mutase
MNQFKLNWPSRIVMVRHGESEGNKYGRSHMYKVAKKPTHQYGLTELGSEQAKAVGKYIDRKFGADSFDCYFTSTYARAQNTFDHMFGGKKKDGRLIEPIIDSRLNEIHRGMVALFDDHEIASGLPLEKRTFDFNGWFHNIPANGQSCVMLEHVIHQFLAFLREGCANRSVIIVGHGTWINLCCRILLNRSVDEALALHKAIHFKNAGVTVFEKDEAGDLVQTMESFVDWGA